MSDSIYEDVIRTESEGMNREREEVMVEIYESVDHDFRTETNTQQPLQRTGSDRVKSISSRAAPVCLVLLCVLLLTAVIVLSVYIQTKNMNCTEEREQPINITNFTEEREQLLTNISKLTEEREQLLTNITNLTEEREQLLTNISKLTEEREQLLTKITNYTDLIKRLDEMGWIYYRSSLYYISSQEKSWTESRRYCTERGADLIIINNKEEQDFVKKLSAGASVWIGLTDSNVEGRWKWVDGTNMNSVFWGSREPNGGTGENCVLTYSPGWADYPCNDHYQWICEKTIKTSH